MSNRLISDIVQLVPIGERYDDSYICIDLLGLALAEEYVGNIEKFNWLIKLTIEHRLISVRDDLAVIEDWSKGEIKLGEIAYAEFEKAAVAKLTAMLTPDDEHNDLQGLINSTTYFLWQLPIVAYENIKKIVSEVPKKMRQANQNSKPGKSA